MVPDELALSLISILMLNLLLSHMVPVKKSFGEHGSREVIRQN